MTRRTAFAMAVLAAMAAVASAAPATTQPAMHATEVKAFFRDGQTFITWKEDPGAEFYGIYRDVKPITTAGLQSSPRSRGSPRAPPGSRRCSQPRAPWWPARTARTRRG